MVIARWAVVLGLFYVVAGVGVDFLSGEVAELETGDPRGGALQTSVWVVDLSGEVWIRATNPDALWLARLRADPDVRLLRDGVRSPRRALILDDFDDQIALAMREKYGRADAVMAWMRDPGDYVSIRLEPLRESDRWSESYP